MQSQQVETFFSQFEQNFPEPDADGKIETAPFLAASNHLATFFGLLGTVFTPVKSDISGNVEKLLKYYKRDPVKYKFINDLIVLESKEKGSIAIDALLWLKRALEFTLIFLEQIVTDRKVGKQSEDLRAFCQASYEKTLKPFHGWMVQQIFSLVSRACPWRKDLIVALALGKENCDQLIYSQMETTLVILRKDLDIINNLYMQYNLHSNAKV